ncbi:MAG: DUF692 domain-containing protein [Spirochaetia bacterium]|nr:DUF692 domain-containing protein [Spirochaetia bacterium]
MIGYGAGLRREHYPFLESGESHTIEWFEAISENYMDSAGRPRRILEHVRRDFPVALHGVSLSIGRADGVNKDYLKRLRALIDATEPFIVSDHLCWTGLNTNLHDLLPLPFNQEALDVVSRNIAVTQEILGRSIALENVSTYLTFKSSTMSEWEFLVAATHGSGARILLDVNNVYVNAINHGFDPRTFIHSIPAELVAQIHVAGHSDLGTHLFDTHSTPIANPVLDLLTRALKRFPGTPVLLEWDENIPEFRVLEAEVQKARKAGSI